MNKLKQKYNENLKRYINGCKYIEENKEEAEKWLPKLMKILQTMETTLTEINNTEEISKEEIMKGFKL